MNIYVGNLSYEVTEEELKNAFSAFGEVSSARVITDKFSGRSKGFGFVEMPNDTEGEAAINGLNGSELNGRPIKVNQAQPKPQGGGNRGGGRGGQGGQGGRRGGSGGRGGQGNFGGRRY